MVRRLGGVATRAQLLTVVSRRQLEHAVAEGRLWRAGRGRYVLPTSPARRRAVAAGGVISHLTAALHWGWGVMWPPDLPWITVPPGHNVSRRRFGAARVYYAALGADDVVDGVTAPLRTVLDCARRLPFAEGLAVADSALRSGLVAPDELRAAAAGARGPGCRGIRLVAAQATRLAANPFESALRAVTLEFEGLTIEPQGAVVTRFRTYHPDLVERARRLAIEADSWEFHSSRDAHARDCVRYTELTLAGWRVLRFTWAQVMQHPDHVRGVLTALLDHDEPELRSSRDHDPRDLPP